MMAIGLVPYHWKTDGAPHWALPDGATSAIDLRRLSQITDTTAVGYAIAIYPGDLPAGSVELDTGDATRDRDVWFSTLGFRPEGTDAIEWTWSHLLDGADDSHADTCRPLRCGRPDKFELWLGGRRERMTTHIDRLKQGVYVRRDLDRIFDDVAAGKLPDGIHRKALKAEADRLGIDWRTLRSKSARWRNEDAVEPTTTITDEGWAGTSQALSAYGWTVLGTGNTWTTGAGDFVFSGNTNSGVIGLHPTALSASDAIATATSPTSAGDLAGPLCRASGTTDTNWNGYGSGNNAGEGSLQLYSFVNAAATVLGQSFLPASAPHTRRVQAIGSTIKADDAGTTWKVTVTSTAITTGLRAGLFGIGGGFSNVTINTFTADDFVSSSAARGRRVRLLKRPVYWL